MNKPSMKKQFFFINALALITAGFLLVWESPPESFLRPQSGKVQTLPSADSYMHEVTSYKFADSGAKQFTLNSDKASYYNNKSLLIMDSPTLQSTQTSKPETIKIVAEKGLLSTDSETLELIGDVNAHWYTDEGKKQLTAGKITYLITSDTAQAEGGFQLNTPQAQLTGKTLSTDLQNGTTTITSRVRAIYEPH